MQTITQLGIALVISLLTLCSANKNNYEMAFSYQDPFSKEWKSIDSLDNRRLPKQALAKVLTLLDRAKALKDSDQIIKAMLYRAKYTAELNEEGRAKAILELQTEMDRAEGLTKALLQSILAETYLGYYQGQQWVINQRTALEEPTDDLKIWTANQFLEKGKSLYLASLENPSVTRRPISDLEFILYETFNASSVQPTVYNFLADRAIVFFTNYNNLITESVGAYSLDDPKAFALPTEFAAADLKLENNSAGVAQALALFQALTKFHANDSSADAMIDISRRRLGFAKQHGVMENNSELYRDGLRALADQYKSNDEAAYVLYDLADYYRLAAGRRNEAMTSKNKDNFKKALAVIGEIEKNYKHTKVYKRAIGLRVQILQPALSLQIENALPSKHAGLALANIRNIDRLHWKVIRVSDQLLARFRQIRREQLMELLNKQDPVLSWKDDLSYDQDHHFRSFETSFDGLGYGRYAVIVADKSELSKNANYQYAVFQVTDLALVQVNNRKAPYLFLVTDRITGAPKSGVSLELKPNKGMAQNFVTDANGSVSVKAKMDRGNSITLKNGEDVYKPQENIYFSQYNDYRQTSQRVHFFLDRKIYRPQQTIFFKGIAMAFDKTAKPTILANEKVEVQFYNPNGEQVDKQSFTTNEFGSFHGSFLAPGGGLLGSFSIRSSEGGSINFNVEEYKRPKFEVALEQPKGETTLNEMISIKGSANALAGYAIDQAKVNYRITRQANFPWCPWWRIPSYYNRNAAEIANGVTETKADGSFEFSFLAKPDATIKGEDRPEFTYSITVDVTDGNGETRSNTTTVRAGYVGFVIEHNLGNLIDIQSIENLKINAKNLGGEPASVDGQVKLYPLEKPQEFFINRYWKKPDLYKLDKAAFKNKFPLYAYGDEDEKQNWKKGTALVNGDWKATAEKEFDLPKNRLSPGYYWLEIEAADSKGIKATKSEIVQLFDGKTAENPGAEFYFPNSKQTTWKPGETFGLSLQAFDPIHVYYEFSRGFTPLKSDWVGADKGIEISTKVTEADRGGFAVYYVFNRHNRIFRQLQRIDVPWSNKELTIETSTFREKLRPGDEETWSVKIKGPQGEAMAAELLAGMYDASLDAFAPNSYGLNIWPQNYSQQSDRSFGFGSQSGRGYAVPVAYPKNLEGRNYSAMNWFRFQPSRVSYLSGARFEKAEMEVMSAAPPRSASKKMRNADMAMDEAVENVMVDADADGMAGNANMNESEATGQGAEEQGDPVRTNLDETVFFMPDLKTDADGNVSFEFTMNEALTKWKYLLFAHSKDLATATLSKEVQTQKELMVVPNPPRFFREGDKISFSGKVVNLSEKPLSGEVSLEFADINAQTPVDIFAGVKAEQLFTVEPGQSQSFTWDLAIPMERYQALTHTMRAKAGNFSDGEQDDLPVLTNRMMITEALPLPVKSNETKTFDFARMNEIENSPTASVKQFSLEYTSNPAWYAVMALPYLMEYPYECSEQIFSRYYANQLAASIANANPKIKSVFEKWKNTDALLSNLSKNQELKTALLEETPWVMEARSEEEQKKNIGILFDLVRLGNESKTAISQLKVKQNPDGGFGWFSGGRSNLYITQHILTGFGHLNRLGVASVFDDPQLRGLIDAAVRFTDAQFLENYLEMKKMAERNGGKLDPKSDHLSPGIIQYFYMRSFFKAAYNIPQNEAYAFYYPQLELHWTNKRLINQAQIALISKRDDKDTFAQNILTSFRERALHHDELGMYWKYGGGYYWYDQPIETHAFMIECFDEVDPKVAEMDALKTWLLKNKQTNRWETTKSTSLAIYALLVTGDGGVKSLNTDKLAKVKIGNYALAATGAEAGSGYFKQSWAAGEIPQNANQITVSNPNPNIAWGAAYLQYFEDLDKITSYEETPVTIQRTVFKETNTDDGPKLFALDKGTALEPGDRVKVRIEIRVDRDMEFVHMKDGRGSGFEPENVLSGYRWQGRLGYYESTRDASTNFFIDFLPKGTHVFEYPLRAVHQGDFSAGVTTLQCMYAPEYTTHAESIRLIVE